MCSPSVSTRAASMSCASRSWAMCCIQESRDPRFTRSTCSA
jgi:hypothetical protein